MVTVPFCEFYYLFKGDMGDSLNEDKSYGKPHFVMELGILHIFGILAIFPTCRE